MSQEDLFGEEVNNGTPAPQPKPADNQDLLLTKLMEIKNPDGQPKYDSFEKAIDALAHSQQYIPSIKAELEQKDAELAELKAKQESSGNVEDIVNKLLEAQKNIETPATIQEAPMFDESKVATIVRREQENLAKEAVLKQNTERVQTELTKHFGDNAKQEIAKVASKIGISTERLGQLASEAPDLVLGHFNIESKQTLNPTIPEVNTSRFQESKPNELAPPTKSLLSGATEQEQKEYMRKIKEDVYAKWDVKE